MVETSALKHRASSVARLMASRQLVALRLESAGHSVLFVERDSLRADFMFLAGSRPRVTELFRGSAVDLVLERSRLKAEAARADVVAAPWNFFAPQPDTLRWYPFLDAGLAVAPSLEDQLARVPSLAHRKKLRAVLGDPAVRLRVSHARKDFERFYRELYVPFARRSSKAAEVDGPVPLRAAFTEGGALALVTSRAGRLLAGALLVTRRRGTLGWHRSGFADAASLTPAQLAQRSAALEVAVFTHAQQLGFALLDFGFAPSLLTHPLFAGRRRLGCTFSPTPSSPALMLTVKPAVRPALFARAPLLTGEAGALVVQAGCAAGRRLSDRSLRAEVTGFDVAGCERVHLTTDVPRGAHGRALWDRVLAREVPGLRVEVEEV